ncbi:jmjC domain-containing protein 5-like [Pomacea canaliculata]|uniref:jmjC domain-containing protein 5-like n=1 Tax=Pomacea canaliculata TaxID=400727 RepID=UPI000D73095D|nr:jmjC domain-containing protein 5-like [Pomacea canaliculata]
MARTVAVLSVCVISAMIVVDAKIGFVKDLSMDATFPPPVFRPDPSIPEGHLRPLGWQRRPDGPVRSEREMPNTREFYSDYVDKSIPVVFRNGVTEAPAFTLWEKDEYLMSKYGKQNVTVTVKVMRHRDEVHTAPQVMTLKKFMYNYLYEEWYLASTIPPALMAELPVPKCLRCGTISRSLQEAELWVSSGGTSSRLHSHDDHNLHCVFFGRRDFILIDNQFRNNFAFIHDYEGSLSGHSRLNMEIINSFKYKNIIMTPWIWSTLYPGDCIFIPAGYLHQVRSYGRSISLTVKFAPSTSFDDNGCKLIEEEFLPLTEASFTWTFTEGRRHLSNSQLNAETLKNLLLLQMGTRHSLSRDKFRHFYQASMASGSEHPPADEVFAMLAGEGKQELGRLQLISLADDLLLAVAAIFNSAQPGYRQHATLHEEF